MPKLSLLLCSGASFFALSSCAGRSGTQFQSSPETSPQSLPQPSPAPTFPSEWTKGKVFSVPSVQEIAPADIAGMNLVAMTCAIVDRKEDAETSFHCSFTDPETKEPFKNVPVRGFVATTKTGGREELGSTVTVEESQEVHIVNVPMEKLPSFEKISPLIAGLDGPTYASSLPELKITESLIVRAKLENSAYVKIQETTSANLGECDSGLGKTNSGEWYCSKPDDEELWHQIPVLRASCSDTAAFRVIDKDSELCSPVKLQRFVPETTPCPAEPPSSGVYVIVKYTGECVRFLRMNHVQ